MAGPSGLPLPFCNDSKTKQFSVRTAQHGIEQEPQRGEVTEMKFTLATAFFGRTTFQTPEWRRSNNLVEWKKRRLGFKNARVPRTCRARRRTGRSPTEGAPEICMDIRL